MTTEHVEAAKTVRTLNSLLRGEISAANTYGLAIPQVTASRSADAERLRSIAREHDATVKHIREVIVQFGGTPDEATTVWPPFVRSVSGPGHVFVEAAALKALKDGEEQGLEAYHSALDNLNAETVTFVRESVIPARMRHITTLDEMIARL
ncbi:MAG: DUF2383 domain-containing protein [Gemmatimonadota bacterium]